MTPPPAVPARVVEAIDFMAEEIMCWGWESPGATKAKAALLAAIADAIEAARDAGWADCVRNAMRTTES